MLMHQIRRAYLKLGIVISEQRIDGRGLSRAIRIQTLQVTNVPNVQSLRCHWAIPFVVLSPDRKEELHVG